MKKKKKKNIDTKKRPPADTILFRFFFFFDIVTQYCPITRVLYGVVLRVFPRAWSSLGSISVSLTTRVGNTRSALLTNATFSDFLTRRKRSYCTLITRSRRCRNINSTIKLLQFIAVVLLLDTERSEKWNRRSRILYLFCDGTAENGCLVKRATTDSGERLSLTGVRELNVSRINGNADNFEVCMLFALKNGRLSLKRASQVFTENLTIVKVVPFPFLAADRVIFFVTNIL